MASTPKDLKMLAKHELLRISPYLYRGELTSNFPKVYVQFGDFSHALPLMVCAERSYGHICIFYSECWIEHGDNLKFNWGLHTFTSNDFTVIVCDIDDSHPGYCYIRYAIVAICEKTAAIDALIG